MRVSEGGVQPDVQADVQPDVQADAQADLDVDVLLETLLHARGHRVTDARRAVWLALHEAEGSHLTVDELTERIARRTGAIDRASIYRTLGLLEELGLVRATQLSTTAPVRWERAHPDEHFHLQCSGCGSVEHHEGDLVARILEHLDAGHGFAVHAVDLTVTGLCAHCRPTLD
jgi:Fur family transcriptional regulator, ferric uptake regulator